MNRVMRAFPIAFAFLVLTIFIVPQYASAIEQTGVSETANFQPYESTNDEVVNVANDTFEYNRDTWDPIPEGIFVGGIIKESLIQLPQVPVGTVVQLGLAQPFKLSLDYAMTGVSRFTIRCPVDFAGTSPWRVDTTIFKMDGPTDYTLARVQTYFGLPDPYGSYQLEPRDTDGVTNLKGVAWHRINYPYSNDITQPGYVRDGRGYFNFMAPLAVDQWYLAFTQVIYDDSRTDNRFNFYMCPDDLCGDANTASRVAYEYSTDPLTTKWENKPIPADLGYSFVFQAGMGGGATGWTNYCETGSRIEWWTCVDIGTDTYKVGALNLVIDFRIDPNTTLTYGVDVESMVNDGGGWVMEHVISHTYWTNQKAVNFILASQPTAHNYTGAKTYAGHNYLIFYVQIWVESGARIQLMFTDNTAQAYVGWLPTCRVMYLDASDFNRGLNFFDLWGSLTVENYTYNKTGAFPLAVVHHSGFWTGIGHWWDKHWMDILGFALIYGGMVLLPFTGGGSFVLISAGIGMFLYNNWPALRHALAGALKFILDGLEWLGNWLYKIGMAIWKVLTWFVDQLINYGSQLIALIIYALAVLVPIIIITTATKLMSVFLKIAKGDLAGAASEGRQLVSTMTAGRIGGV